MCIPAQAVVGMVGAPGGGAAPKLEDQPHAKQIPYAPQPPMWSADKEREPVPVARDAERPVPTARRKVAGAPKGNKNAFKHGGYSAEAIEARRKIATLLRTMRTLVER